MNIEQAADTMTGSVPVIQPQLPQRLSGKIIQIDSGAALQEYGLLQSKHALQDCRIRFFLPFCHRPKCHRSCDIGGSLQILAATVQQKQSLRPKLRIRRFCRTVMNHRPVLSVRSNGLKAGTEIMLLLLPELLQLFRGGTLCDPLRSDMGL